MTPRILEDVRKLGRANPVFLDYSETLELKGLSISLSANAIANELQ